MAGVTDLLASTVAQLRVQTAWGPDIVIDQPFADEPGVGPSPLLSILKPKLTLVDATGRESVYTPYGDPGGTKWPLVALGLGAVGAFLIWRIVQRKQ